MANAAIGVKFITNRLGNQNLVHNGYKFRVKFQRGDRCYWKCSTSTCTATINTRNNIPTKFSDQHNHPADPMEIKVLEMMNRVKSQCQDEILPIPTIYEEELVKLRDREWDNKRQQLVEKLPTFESCKSALYYGTSKVLPVLPKTRADIDLQGKWTETTTGEPFLIVDDGEDNRLLIFATRQNLVNLYAANTYYCDGAFYTCPELFAQLYTIHANVNGFMCPIVYAVLPGKSEFIYTRFLNLLKASCGGMNIQLNPNTIFLDYEVASRNAAVRVFPEVTIKGCFFHYTQCIWRKVQELIQPSTCSLYPDLNFNMLEITDGCNSRDSHLQVINQTLVSMEDDGHVCRKVTDKVDMYEILVKHSMLEDRIKHILITESAKPKYCEKGCHYFHILDELHKTYQYSKVKKSGLLNCLNKLEMQSDIIRTTQYHYLAYNI